MIKISSHDQFAAYLGKELGTSTWYQINQEQINKFADATLDHQWIHTNPEKAATDSPFKTTIAHGYLTLSLVPYLWQQIAEISKLKMEINYGIESLKFGQAVTVDSEVRLKASLKSILNLRGITKVCIEVVLEIKDQAKPAFTGEVLFLYHFEA
ncbi:MaoC family dehydratase [Pedobacter xixiisoli]|uniref:Acyl dehydratase n=1 Tax=Pedobacter xixiisoli TaxID=1476464 RepID=A0A285ZRS5_9SPHI|nr:MaoC family dehydratase [Pedobacter xixiisoli]SOD12349.1 Acyl dehydratase [Pedobacter xixiisoli]